jgi:hypothetical protein
LKQFLFEEMRKIDLLWEIVQVQVCFECLMFMNFVALILYCVKHALATLLSFSKKLQVS